MDGRASVLCARCECARRLGEVMGGGLSGRGGWGGGKRGAPASSGAGVRGGWPSLPRRSAPARRMADRPSRNDGLPRARACPECRYGGPPSAPPAPRHLLRPYGDGADGGVLAPPRPGPSGAHAAPQSPHSAGFDLLALVLVRMFVPSHAPAPPMAVHLLRFGEGVRRHRRHHHSRRCHRTSRPRLSPLLRPRVSSMAAARPSRTSFCGRRGPPAPTAKSKSVEAPPPSAR